MEKTMEKVEKATELYKTGLLITIVDNMQTKKLYGNT